MESKALSKKKLKIDESSEKELKKAHYRVYGHSVVDVCHYTKKSLKGEGVCYKRKFFGIETHRCMEFSPAGLFCHNRCIYCWRPTNFYKIVKMKKDEVDNPSDIIENLLKLRNQLLTGFGGNEKVIKKIYEEAKIPSHFAISLMGEPTLYPKLAEMIRYIKHLPFTKSIFLVTNGQEPKMLEKLEKENALPTQIYLSMNAGNEETFKKVNYPLKKDFWKRFNKSLDLLSQTKTRSLIRITLIRGLNDSENEIKDFAELIEKGNPHFVEVKSYMHVGYSKKRLTEKHMLSLEEIKKWGFKLLSYLPNFKYMDEDLDGRIVIFQNMRRFVDRWILKPSSSTLFEYGM
ncbi:MAG: 4-demethylwyosine synthase TYW1 [Candidatus Woesearchaeota archaeon]